jgi:hypothetical protein
MFLLIYLKKKKKNEKNDRLKRRLPNSTNSGAMSSTSRRYSADSFDRLVEDRLRNRPPPYSPDQDKPPSYEESFHDTSNRHHSPTVSYFFLEII